MKMYLIDTWAKGIYNLKLLRALNLDFLFVNEYNIVLAKKFILTFL